MRLKQMRGWRDELAATEDGERFMPQKARGDGRRSSDEEKRDSSLRGPARKQRAQEKNRAAPLGMTVGVGWCAVPRPHGLG